MNDKISIKIDSEAVKSDAFLKAVSAFFKIAKNVSEEFTRGKNQIEWFATVKEGSNIVIGQPRTKNHDETLALEVVRIMFEGIQSISNGHTQRPKFFNDAALEGVRAIATTETGIITIQNNRGVAHIQSRAATTVDVILGTVHKSFGDIEGKLTVLSDQAGFKFYITEPIHGLEITCYITNDELIEKAVTYFRQRVSAAGLIKYRRDGTPISVDVDDLVAFEDDSFLPTTQDIIGIYKKE